MAKKIKFFYSLSIFGREIEIVWKIERHLIFVVCTKNIISDNRSSELTVIILRQKLI